MATKLRTTNRRGNRTRRRGNILVLSAILMILMAACVAFAVDLGVLYVARSELQRAADAAALSAAWELIDQNALTGTTNQADLENDARNTAIQFASLNTVLASHPLVSSSDVEVGYISDVTDPNATMSTTSNSSPNAVRVHVKKTNAQNGRVGFTFARILGVFGEEVEAQATAVLITNFGGFRIPGDGGNLGILPIALDQETWDDLLGGGGSDSWSWDEATQTVTAGSDGIRELNLYPEGTGSPGNRGTVDIGSSNNSTAVLSRQILDGVTPADMAYHGGELKFDSNGKLFLNGETGISAGIKDDLAAIMGQPRIIPVFEQVQGPGNNATYTIVKFVGIRILDVKLTGSNASKRVIVQPATMIARGAIPSSTAGQSYYTYSNVWLIK